ncbi:enoyl-CoA hydratase [Dietzia sp.]|uniref:enoyl-CoA hydratase n=1 Tax=Dietzia sp. TaxID=1871616 RepID=UPI002FD93003
MLEVRREGKVAVIAIDRHEKRNSINADVSRALREAFEAQVETLETDDPVRVIMFTGNGSAFSAGADLGGGVYSEEFGKEHEKFLRTVESIPIPVVAAINGPAVGAGVQMALAADLRVMDPNAFLAVPVVKVGLALDWWTVHRASAVVGGGHARTMLFSARPVDAAFCERVGFANSLGDAEEALLFCTELAEFAPLSLRHIKAVINSDLAVAEHDPKMEELQRLAWHSDDAKEFRRAREENRNPEFRGE